MIPPPSRREGVLGCVARVLKVEEPKQLNKTRAVTACSGHIDTAAHEAEDLASTFPQDWLDVMCRVLARGPKPGCEVKLAILKSRRWH